LEERGLTKLKRVRRIKKEAIKGPFEMKKELKKHRNTTRGDQGKASQYRKGPQHGGLVQAGILKPEVSLVAKKRLIIDTRSKGKKDGDKERVYAGTSAPGARKTIV